MQSCLTHAPPLQAKPLPQGVADHESPSLTQVSTRVASPLTHRVAPATQDRARHTPSRQLSVEPQGTSLVPNPFGSHTARAVALVHVIATPGEHTKARHAPAAASQPCPTGHDAVAPKPNPSVLQDCVASAPTHRVDPGAQVCGTHAPARHDCPIGHGIAA